MSLTLPYDEKRRTSALKLFYGYFDAGLGFAVGLLYVFYLNGGLGSQRLLNIHGFASV